jgi:anti-anti-sigma factor
LSSGFHTSAEDLGQGLAIVVVSGEVDLHTAPELKRHIGNAIDGGGRFLLVDLSSATFIDSTTLGVLMGAVRRVQPLGGEVVIACVDANIRRIFEITLLDRVLLVFDSPEAGLEHLRGLDGVASSGLSA